MRRFYFENSYNDSETKYAAFHPNMLNIVVGCNGYGKTSFLRGLERHLKRKHIECISWSDSHDGRTDGMNQFLWSGNMEGLAAMAFHSEGQAMLASFGRKCIQMIGHKVRNHEDLKELFIIVDQIDSGLDIHMINDIKKTFKAIIIEDMKIHGVDAYIVMSANSYTLVKGEYCIDPITRKPIIFNNYEEYANYIESMYKDDEE
jgi:hypothetical protein